LIFEITLPCKAKDGGEHDKRQGLAGNYNWYWEKWSIDKLVLESVEIEYMDGIRVSINGKDFNYEWQ